MHLCCADIVVGCTCHHHVLSCRLINFNFAYIADIRARLCVALHCHSLHVCVLSYFAAHICWLHVACSVFLCLCMYFHFASISVVRARVFVALHCHSLLVCVLSYFAAHICRLHAMRFIVTCTSILRLFRLYVNVSCIVCLSLYCHVLPRLFCCRHRTNMLV